MINEQISNMQWSAFPEAARRVDLLLGHAMVMDDRWDGLSVLIGEAMGIALLMSAQYPIATQVWVPGLREMSLSECIDAALIEVQEWDLCWSVDVPDMTRLRVLLSDLRRELAADAKLRG